MKKETSEELISKSFERALEDGTVTDLMENKMDSDELIQESLSVEGQKELSFDKALKVLKGTQGKVLTIVDATYTDDKRLKYVKDLIKDAFSSQADWLFELTIRELECVNGCSDGVACHQCPK